MEADGRKPNKIKRFFLAPFIGLRYLCGKIIGEDEKVTEDDILSLVEDKESGVIENTKEIIANAFEFDDLEVKDVMTHRINVVGVNADSSLDDVIYTALETGFSRLPVYSENLDNITGIIIVKDLLSLVGKTRDELEDFSLHSFIRKVEFVPESSLCTNTLTKMKELKASMAIIVDEYGGTAGILTMEDLVEEVMGSIQDEYDDEETEIEQLKDKDNEEKYKIDGETDPEEVLELFGHELPENHEYETIAGFVTDLLGYIPEQTDLENEQELHIDYKDVRFVVKDMEDNCISRIIAFRRKERSQE
jgi:putative hemolysin